MAETEAPPSVIPVFPLAGALLLPRGQLPLNIFEPRYLAMVKDVMGGDRLIGMIQPRQAGPQSEPALYDTGCAGRITDFHETDDGRFLITLKGLTRFHVVEELSRMTAYRQVKADYSGFEGDRLTPMREAGIDRAGLIEGLKAYLGRRGLQADWKAIEKAPDETLVNSLAMICPFSPAEKQALLEADSLRTRTETMIALMEMAGSSDDDESAGPSH